MLENNEASPLKEVYRLTVFVLLFFILKETRMKEEKRMTSDLRPYEGKTIAAGLGSYSIKY